MTETVHEFELTRDLLDAHGAAEIAYADLPLEAQKSLLMYMAYDGEAWDASPVPVNAAGDQDIDLVAAYFAKVHGDVMFGLVELPAALIQRAIMESPVMAELNEAEVHYGGEDARITTWEQYHEHYLKLTPYRVRVPTINGMKELDRGRPPGGTETWPVILDLQYGGVLQDGWHRLHQYMADGMEMIPCLFDPRASRVE